MKTDNNKAFVNEHTRRRSLGKRLFGFLLIVAGVLWAMQTAGYELPIWLLTWQMLLISIGVLGAITKKFRPDGWLIPFLIGLFFILDDYSNIENIRDYLIPAGLVLLGSLVLFFRKKDRCGSHNWSKTFDVSETTEEKHLKVHASFGSVQKTVVNKDFLGGDIYCRLGSTEVNLLLCDIKDSAVIDIYCRLGSCKLIVPSNWLVKSEIDVSMASVEDNRMIMGDADPDKTLILKGNVSMGSIEITSN